MKIELNQDFFDMLLYATGEYLIFNNNEDEFLPKELTHSYLLNKTNIDKNILDFYYSKNQMFQNEISDSEFKSMQEHGYLGTKKTLFSPYSIKIHGAYHIRADFYAKICSIKSDYFIYKIGGKDIKNLNDLEPYFKDYSAGFKKGFFEFEENKIKPFLPLYSDKQDFVNLNFEFINGFFLGDNSSWFSVQGFCSKCSKDSSDNEITDAYEDGLKNGYKYRAWSYVFSNNKLFAPLFVENIQPQPESDFDTSDFDTSDKYIFNEDVLKSFSRYDGLLWEKLNIDWFRLKNPTKIELKKNDCTQRMFVYFFDKYLDKELCKNPTDWLKLIFTKHFSLTNQRKEIEVLQNPINKRDKKSIAFNVFTTKFNTLFIQN